jgi:nitroreductase
MPWNFRMLSVAGGWCAGTTRPGPCPPEVVDRIVQNGLRAPSAGFSQGWGFLVLDNPADVARFRDAVRPETNPED